MSFKYCITLAALAMLPLAATAQSMPQQPAPSDAHAVVPATSYHFAFKNYSPPAGEKTTPNRHWHAANLDVQADDGHGGHVMKPGPQATAPDAQSDTPPASPPGQVHPESDPHAHHHAKGK